MNLSLTVQVRVHEWSEGVDDGYGGTEDVYTPPLDQPGGAHLVFAIYTGSSEEPKVAGHDRVIVDGSMIGPAGIVSPHGRVTHNTLGAFEVVGEPEDYNNNPWFQPGVVVYNLRRVEG